MSAIYTGAQCPHCTRPLAPEELRSGIVTCAFCKRPFEATLLEARERSHDVVAVAAETPEGVATACANHPGNAAATSCQRCGLFICALCDMNVGDGSFCPSCFDRMRAEGGLRGVARRQMDYAMLARIAAILGLMPCFWGVPAPLGVWWASKGIAQRRNEGVSARGMIFVLIVCILEVLAYLLLVGFMIWAMVNAP